MGFMEVAPKRYGVGPIPAKIMFVGDHPDQAAFKDGRPYSGASLTVLENCLHMAGLTKAEIYMTCLRDDRIHVEDMWNDKAKNKLYGSVEPYWTNLQKEIEEVNPQVIAASGKVVSRLMTGKQGLTSIRGYPFSWNNRIVVPVLQPHDMVWSNYIWRHYLSHDLSKIARYTKGWTPPTWKTLHDLSFNEFVGALKHILHHGTRTSYDIEVSNFEVSCIGFTLSRDTAITVPFDSRWTEEEELALWQLVSAILENPNIKKVGQNNIFDIYFLAYRMGIFVRGFSEDTMMAHSIMYPDFLKSLNFLASIYTDLPYWKDMADFKNIKKEA